MGSFVTGLFQNIQEQTKGLVFVLADEQAIRRYRCLSPTLGESSNLKSSWRTILSKNFQLPFLISPKPDNKLYTKEKVFRLKTQ